MERSKWLFTFIVLVSSISAAQQVPQRVQVKLVDVTNVRQTARNGKVLVEEYVLPQNSVIEVSTRQYQQPAIMRFWNSLIGHEETPEPFVRDIKLISAPGYTEAEVAEFNRDNGYEPLYMSKRVLDTAEVIESSLGRQEMRTEEKAPVYESQDVTAPPHRRRRLDPREADRIVEKIGQANRSTRVTGTAQEHCETCQSGFADRWIRAGVPANALRKALEFYQQHRSEIRNKRYITINDFSEHSSEKRMFVLDMKTGAVEKHFVAHGKASDAGNAGAVRSLGQHHNQTPPGFLLTAETYTGHNGYSLRLDGLERQNAASRRRLIVMHPAHYVSAAWRRQNGMPGRSNGCVAVDPTISRSLIDQLKGGSLMLNYDGE